MHKLLKTLKWIGSKLIDWFFGGLISTLLSTFTIASISTLLIIGYDNVIVFLNLSIINLPEKLKLYHILILILTLLLTVFVNYLFKKLVKKSNYYFIKKDGFKWRVEKWSGQVAWTPYCPKHNLCLREDKRYDDYTRKIIHSFFCESCNKRISAVFLEEDIVKIHNKVSRIAEAKLHGYGKKI